MPAAPEAQAATLREAHGSRCFCFTMSCQPCAAHVVSNAPSKLTLHVVHLRHSLTCSCAASEGAGCRPGQRACTGAPLPPPAAGPPERRAAEQGPAHAAEPQGRAQRAKRADQGTHAPIEARARERPGPMPAQGRPKRAIRQPARFRSPGAGGPGSDAGACEEAAEHEAEAVRCPPQAQLKRLKRGREVLVVPDQAPPEGAPAMHASLEDSLPACLDEQPAPPPVGDSWQGGAVGYPGCGTAAADEDLSLARKRRASDQPIELDKKRRRMEVGLHATLSQLIWQKRTSVLSSTDPVVVLGTDTVVGLGRAPLLLQIQEDDAEHGHEAGADQMPSSPARQPPPEPLQPPTPKLGCSKCRGSKSGCSVCRVKAGLPPLASSALDRFALTSDLLAL